MKHGDNAAVIKTSTAAKAETRHHTGSVDGKGQRADAQTCRMVQSNGIRRQRWREKMETAKQRRRERWKQLSSDARTMEDSIAVKHRLTASLRRSKFPILKEASFSYKYSHSSTNK